MNNAGPSTFPPTMRAARERIAAVWPQACARTRNALGSGTSYLFDAADVARHALAPWHNPCSVIDTSYEALDRLARDPAQRGRDKPRVLDGSGSVVPRTTAEPPATLEATAPDPAAVAGCDVGLVHPWNPGELPAALPADTRIIGVFVADFHRAWTWSDRRCDSFSKGSKRVSRELDSSRDIMWSRR